MAAPFRLLRNVWGKNLLRTTQECCALFWANPGSNILKNSNCSATYFQSCVRTIALLHQLDFNETMVTQGCCMMFWTIPSLVWFGLVFNGISTFVGQLMPKPSLWKNSNWKKIIHRSPEISIFILFERVSVRLEFKFASYDAAVQHISPNATRTPSGEILEAAHFKTAVV